MPINPNANTVKILARYRGEVRRAQAEYADAVVELFPVGCTSAYMHGDYRVSCEIVSHSDDRVKVRGRSGSEYWIDASRLC